MGSSKINLRKEKYTFSFLYILKKKENRKRISNTKSDPALFFIKIGFKGEGTMDQTRTLGKTKLKVKRIGFGANAVGGHNLFPNLNDETGKDLVRTALDGGVNFYRYRLYIWIGAI